MNRNLRSAMASEHRHEFVFRAGAKRSVPLERKEQGKQRRKVKAAVLLLLLLRPSPRATKSVRPPSSTLTFGSLVLLPTTPSSLSLPSLEHLSSSRLSSPLPRSMQLLSEIPK